MQKTEHNYLNVSWGYGNSYQSQYLGLCLPKYIETHFLPHCSKWHEHPFLGSKLFGEGQAVQKAAFIALRTSCANSGIHSVNPLTTAMFICEMFTWFSNDQIFVNVSRRFLKYFFTPNQKNRLQWTISNVLLTKLPFECISVRAEYCLNILPQTLIVKVVTFSPK